MTQDTINKTYQQGKISILKETNTNVEWGIEGSATKLDFLNHGTGARWMSIALNGDVTINENFHVAATKKIYLDGGGDTYIMEQSPDDIQWIVGGSELLRLVGNTVRVPGAYANTTASAVNMRVSSDGDLSRSTSSLRYKKDIEDYSLESSRAVIAGLRPITYRGKDDEAGERKHLGFIAEEVHEVEQQLVTYIDLDGEEAPDYVEYDRVVAPLVKVIQDLMDRIEALEA